jgi:hypothetical protein
MEHIELIIDEHRVKVDAAWAERLDGLPMQIRTTGQSLKYAYVKVDGEWSPMHRLLLNPGPGLDVDHRNRDTLDNRLENLRPATRSQNLQNRRGWGAHGKGVVYHKARPGKGPAVYEARITINGKKTYLGRSSDPAVAAAMYAEAARKHFGEFACLENRRRVAK